MVMTIRVMSAGRGYKYLLKSVASGDADRDTGTPLTRCYSAEGVLPGSWLGSVSKGSAVRILGGSVAVTG
jgi:hypothetical protein